MQEENALVTEYEKLLASAKIDWDGEILNLSLLGPYLKHKDPEVRRRAYEKQNAFFMGIADKLDELYDKLVKSWALRVIQSWGICVCSGTATRENRWKI